MNPRKEFIKNTISKMPIGKIEGVGVCTKANKIKEEATVDDKVEVIEDQKELPISDKEEFNPGIVQDANKNSQKEGGISSSRTTGQTGMSGIKPPVSPNNREISNVNKFELEGFSIEYSMPGSKDIISEEVSGLYFDTLELAMATVSDDKFVKILGENKTVMARITRGAPQICRNEVLKMEYIGEKWRRT